MWQQTWARYGVDIHLNGNSHRFRHFQICRSIFVDQNVVDPIVVDLVVGIGSLFNWSSVAKTSFPSSLIKSCRSNGCRSMCCRWICCWLLVIDQFVVDNVVDQFVDQNIVDVNTVVLKHLLKCRDEIHRDWRLSISIKPSAERKEKSIWLSIKR